MLIPHDRPAYRILAPNGFFGPDCHLYGEGDCIIFDDEPNEEMEALNEPARERLRALYTKLDEFGREAADKNGRKFAGRPRSIEAALAEATQDARRVQLIAGDGGVPIMGTRATAATIEKIEDREIADTTRRRPGRPKGSGKLQVNA